jgi:hypothetical protein
MSVLKPRPALLLGERKMKVEVLEKFMHDKLGTLRKGDIVDFPDNQAKAFLQRGAIQPYETKVIRQNPLPDAGAEKQLSASPAAPVLAPKTLTKSKAGKKKGAAR